MSVGTAMRELRIKRGLTQTQLANLMKIAQGHVCDLELGRRQFTESMIFTAAKALEIPPSEFIGMADRLTRTDRAA